MRLERIRRFLDEAGYAYTYSENDDCGGIELTVRGLNYHIWEYPEPERGAASNVLSAGRMADYEGDYEGRIIDVMRAWR